MSEQKVKKRASRVTSRVKCPSYRWNCFGFRSRLEPRSGSSSSVGLLTQNGRVLRDLATPINAQLRSGNAQREPERSPNFAHPMIRPGKPTETRSNLVVSYISPHFGYPNQSRGAGWRLRTALHAQSRKGKWTNASVPKILTGAQPPSGNESNSQRSLA